MPQMVHNNSSVCGGRGGWSAGFGDAVAAGFGCSTGGEGG
jgi:hypothetical protein